MTEAPPHSRPPAGTAWLEETGFLGCEQALPEIYGSTRRFGAFSTCPESASPPGSSKCWRGLPTADTHIFRAHYHLSSRQPPRRRRVLAANGPPCPQSTPVEKPASPKCHLPPPPSVPRRLPRPENPSRGLPQHLVLMHLFLLCFPPSPDPGTPTLPAGPVPPEST